MPQRGEGKIARVIGVDVGEVVVIESISVNLQGPGELTVSSRNCAPPYLSSSESDLTDTGRSD
jgi:hypothetical protein